MSLLSWQELSDTSAQKKAFMKIVEFCCAYDFAIPDYYDLTHILMATAIKGMDYNEISPSLYDITHPHMIKTRTIRLMHFMDDTLEFFNRRLALALEDDRYIDPLMFSYIEAKKTRKSGSNQYTAKPDLETLMGVFEYFKDELIAQGLPRLSIARAFLDMSFVVARLCPREEYKIYCEYMCEALNPDHKEIATAARLGRSDLVNKVDEISARLKFDEISAISDSIH